MVKAGVSTLKDLIYLRNVKPKLFEDIGKLKESVPNRTSTKEFTKFKKNYPELFDGTLRKFNRSKVKNVLAQIRRAYNHGKQSKIPIHIQSAIQLENAYKNKGISIINPPKPPINRFDWILSLYGRGTVMDKISYYQTTITNPDLITQNPAILDLPQNDITYMNGKGVNEWRIIVKVRFKGRAKGRKDYGYVSSKYVPLWDNLSLVDQINNMQSYIISADEYEWVDISAVIEDIDTIFINWR